MALRDEEQRQLAEIERRLTEDDPDLARRLARRRPLGLVRLVLAVVAMLVSLTVGLGVTAVGSEVNSLPVAVIGIVVAVGLPTLIIYRVWLRRLP